MISYSSIEELDVFREGQAIGGLKRLPKGCIFRYTDEFLASSQPPVALHLPKTPDGLLVEGLSNLPTFFAGLLPEGVMFQAIRTVIRTAADDLFSLLAATGRDTIGDIEIRIPGASDLRTPLDLAQAEELVDLILKKPFGLNPALISGIPGVQPKLSIGGLVRASRAEVYIAKFESSLFPRINANEEIFMNLARRCGLKVPDVRLIGSTLIIKRFDRTASKRRTKRKLHVEDMLQAMDLFPNSKYSLEYSELLARMVELQVSKAALLDALRLYLYSWLIGNSDLHAKNVSLIQDPVSLQWKLSPCYDLLSTLPFSDVIKDGGKMALALHDEAHGRFELRDFVDVAAMFDLPEGAVIRMVKQTSQALKKQIHTLPVDLLGEETIQTIRDRVTGMAD
jgi:serine/threonine-protein kinase HipA